MEAFFKDIRFGVRTLLRRPGFASIVVLMLALGIGACTAIFSVVDGVLLRSLPYPEAERLVELREVNAKGRPISFAEPNFLDVRDRSHTLEGVAEYSGGTTTVTGGSEPARIPDDVRIPGAETDDLLDGESRVHAGDDRPPPRWRKRERAAIEAR